MPHRVLLLLVGVMIFLMLMVGGEELLKCDGSEEGTCKKTHTCVNQLGERCVGSATGSLLPFVRKCAKSHYVIHRWL